MSLIVFSCNPVATPGHNVQHIDYTHTHNNNGKLFISNVDHFSGSQRLYNSIIEHNVIHTGENTSDHEPIYGKLDIGKIGVAVEETSKPAPPSIVWLKLMIKRRMTV